MRRANVKCCSCFGKNALASARMLLLRQECSCFGKNALASARMLLLPQECSCFDKNALASARMLLLATSFLDAAPTLLFAASAGSSLS